VVMFPRPFYSLDSPSSLPRWLVAAPRRLSYSLRVFLAKSALHNPTHQPIPLVNLRMFLPLSEEKQVFSRTCTPPWIALVSSFRASSQVPLTGCAAFPHTPIGRVLRSISLGDSSRAPFPTSCRLPGLRRWDDQKWFPFFYSILSLFLLCITHCPSGIPSCGSFEGLWQCQESVLAFQPHLQILSARLLLVPVFSPLFPTGEHLPPTEWCDIPVAVSLHPGQTFARRPRTSHNSEVPDPLKIIHFPGSRYAAFRPNFPAKL